MLDELLVIALGGCIALIQQIRLAEVFHMPVGKGAAGHAEAVLFLFRMVERLGQLGAEHNGVDAVRRAQDVGIAGEGQPVGGLACVHKVYGLDGVARDH